MGEKLSNDFEKLKLCFDILYLRVKSYLDALEYLKYTERKNNKWLLIFRSYNKKRADAIKLLMVENSRRIEVIESKLKEM